MTPAIGFRNVSCGVRGAAGSLDAVSLAVPAGQVLAICGPAGAGKAMLLRLAARAVPPRSGAVCLFSRDIWLMSAQEAAATAAWISPEAAVPPGLGPRQVVQRAWRAVPAAVSAAEVDAALQDAGLGAGRGPAFHRLSPLRRVRVLIARALVLRPRIVLLAATGAPAEQHRQLALLCALRAAGTTVVAALGDAGPAMDLADRVVEMAGGRILADRPAGLAAQVRSTR